MAIGHPHVVKLLNLMMIGSYVLLSCQFPFDCSDKFGNSLRENSELGWSHMSQYYAKPSVMAQHL